MRVTNGERERVAVVVKAHIELVHWTSKRPFPGLVNFVLAVAYHFCLNLPEAFLNLGMAF